MDITPLIRELLFGHDCVIIPGFGGFIGNYTPARIDKTSGLFYPPLKQISFNRNLNHNDGLLAGKVSTALNINYPDARNIVEQFACEIRDKLAKGEKVIFDHIGSFVNNHEGNVQFEPDCEANYNLNSFGLTPFRVTPLEGYDVRKKIVPYGTTGMPKHSNFRRYLWRAAVIIPLLGALVAVPLSTNIFKTKVQATNLNPLASVEFENNREAVEKSNSDSLPAVKMNPETEVIRPAEKNIYCIITGSFKSQANAESLIRKLSGEGYTPEILKAPNGFFRVSVLRCTDASVAMQKKDSIARKYSGAWITKIL